MINKIYQSGTSCFIGSVQNSFFCTMQYQGECFFLKLDWAFNTINRVKTEANNFFIYKNRLLASKFATDFITIYDLNNLDKNEMIPYDLTFLNFSFFNNFYLGVIQNYHLVLLNLDTGKVVKDFGAYNCGAYIHDGKKILLFNEKPSKIYDDSTVCSFLRVIDFYTYEPLWGKDLYDFCFYDELFSNNCFERPPTVITSYKDNLLLHFKKHILCLSIETGETIWHIEDRYKEVEVVENRLYLDKWVGYDVIDAHTGKKLQDFVKFSPIISGEDFTYTTPTNGESRYYKGYIWRTTRYEQEGSETLLVIEPTTGKYVHIEKIPAKSMLNAPQFMEDKVILTSRSEAEFFIYQISDFDSLEK